MISRISLAELGKRLTYFPVVCITGPRQVGKTTLARQMAEAQQKRVLYLDLESQKDYALIASDPAAFLENYRDYCVVIDEAQALPDLFTRLRPLIDVYRVPGRFLLLGSANPSLVKGISESLAGRVSYMELAQINLLEIKGSEISQEAHWFRGGLPEGLLAPSDEQFGLWAQGYIESFIQRDLNFLFGTDLPPSLIGRIWSMLAHLNGYTENLEELARSLGITGPTAKRYVEFMEGAYLLQRLPAWFVNAKKRLVKSPKLYLRSTGLLHRILNIRDYAHLIGHPAIGASWEAYVVEQVNQCRPSDTEVSYYRTQHGAESDMVISQGITPVACVEIKLSNQPTISKGFYSSIEDLETKTNFVVTPHAEKYMVKNGLVVCSLAHFLNEELPKLHL